MGKITRQDIALLLKLYKMTDIQLHDYLYNTIQKVYGKGKIVHKKSKYLVAVGSKIGLVAHLDVFGKTPPTEILYNQKYITAIGSVLGGDDRTGVFIILKMLEIGFKPTIIFTHDEEIGCKGACDFAQDFTDIGVNYLVQLDRRGKGVVFYDNDNQDFMKYILSFRDKEEIGSFSDISILCPNCNVSGCNLGVGYYNEHSFGEYQSIEELEDTIDVVLRLLQDEDNSVYYEYQELELAGYDYGYGGYGDYNNWNVGNSVFGKDLSNKISYQGRWITLDEYYHIIYGEGDDLLEIETSNKSVDKESPF